MAEIITRRNLPHWYVPGAAHFVTYRLADSLPTSALDALGAKRDRWLKQGPKANESYSLWKYRLHKQLFAAYDELLDQQAENHWLKMARIAAMVRENLYHHDTKKYDLLAYCIMPNHVHVLFQPIEVAVERTEAGAEAATAARVVPATANQDIGEAPDSASPLARIMHSLKSYTANRANEILKRGAAFWQHESYDHWVRDDDELERIIAYIRANPVKAGLVQKPQDWFFCSTHDRFLMDGTIEGWLLRRASC